MIIEAFSAEELNEGKDPYAPMLTLSFTEKKLLREYIKVNFLKFLVEAVPRAKSVKNLANSVIQ